MDRSLTLGALAQTAGLSKGHLSSIEHGLAALNIETMDRIASALEVPPLYLLTFPADNELSRIADLVRLLPPDELVRVRREMQVLVGLYKR